MNLRSFLRLKPSSRLLVAALGCLPLGNACSSDSTTPEATTTFGVEVVSLDGQAPNGSVNVRCDRGGPAANTAAPGAGGASDGAPSAGAFSTLRVVLSLTPTDPALLFVLRPANACGSSTRCGYIHIEGLDAAGGVLSSVDTATSEGVLQLDLQQLPTRVRVSLIRGIDRKPLQNPDGTDVAVEVTPTFVAPSACAEDVPGSGGAGGENSLVAGAGAGAAAGESSMAGAGAGGDGSLPGLAGAGAGGANDAPSGAGGA